ncbi:MAG: hypothetical protein HYZ42_02615 [Bacteroidetes bacterium]|nr:hypothetical protein [Bacteroidota bacterium]
MKYIITAVLAILFNNLFSQKTKISITIDSVRIGYNKVESEKSGELDSSNRISHKELKIVASGSGYENILSEITQFSLESDDKEELKTIKKLFSEGFSQLKKGFHTGSKKKEIKINRNRSYIYSIDWFPSKLVNGSFTFELTKILVLKD